MAQRFEKEKSTATSTANIIYLVLAMLILLLGILFAIQNADEIKVTFLAWDFRGSMAIVLFVTFMMGILIGVFTSIANLIRKDRVIKRQVLQIEKMENRIEALEREVTEKQKK